MVVLIGIILLIVFILIIRLFGAWMLRIDEIIKLQKEMLVEMKKHFQQKLS
jgi:Tfp pilus assembly protein PilO